MDTWARWLCSLTPHPQSRVGQGSEERGPGTRGDAGREAAWGLSRSPTRTAARAAWHQTRVSRVRGSGLRLWPSGRSSFLRVMLLALLRRGRALLDARLCGDFRGAVRGPSEAPLPPASLGPARRQGCPLQGKPGPRGRRAQEAGSQSSSRSWSVERGAGRLPVAGKDFPAKQLFPAGLGRMPAPDTVLIAAFPLHLHCDPSEFPAPAHRGELEPLSSSAPASGSWSAPGSHLAIWCWLAGESRCSH